MYICEVCGTTHYSHSHDEICNSCMSDFKKDDSSVQRKVKHEFEGLKLQELKNKIEFLLKGQRYAVNKYEEKAELILFVAEFIKRADAIMSGKARKKDILELITENSDVSRKVNDLVVGGKL